VKPHLCSFALAVLTTLGCNERAAPPAPEPATTPATSTGPAPTPAVEPSAAAEATTTASAAEPTAEPSATIAEPSTPSAKTAAPAAKTAEPSPKAPTAAAAGATAAPSAEPTAPARKVATVSGSGASADSFSLGISARSPVKAGESGAASIVLTAKSPYKCNAKYPYKMALDAPSGGVSYASQTVRGMAIADKTSSMSVPFTATAPGKATISGTFSFSICTADKCLIEKRKLAVTIDVD
jgi:hypothetical protein